MSGKRVVLVTGASSGFGRATAETLARRGHAVYAGMRDPGGQNADAAAALHEISEGGLALDVVHLDVTIDELVQAAVARVVEAAGRVDVVVNNAGVGLAGPLEAVTPAQALELFEPNVFGVLRVNRAVLPVMRAQRDGLLVHISALAARLPAPSFGLFSASKAAVEALAEAYRAQLATFGIDSVVIEPGLYPTEIWAKMPCAADEECLGEYQELRERTRGMRAMMAERFARPDGPRPSEVAEAILGLIETPFGQRPLRTIVGEGAPGVRDGVAMLNDAHAAAQRHVQEAFAAAAPPAARK